MDASEIDLSQEPSDCLSLVENLTNNHCINILLAALSPVTAPPSPSVHLLIGQVVNVCDLTFIGEISSWYRRQHFLMATRRHISSLKKQFALK